MQTNSVRLRMLRSCLVRGTLCQASTLIEVDYETASDLLMAAAADIDGPMPAGTRVIPAVAWREPDAERSPTFRILTAANEATA